MKKTVHCICCIVAKLQAQLANTAAKPVQYLDNAQHMRAYTTDALYTA